MVGFRSYLISIDVEHNGCWTEKTRSLDLYVRNLRKEYGSDTYRAVSLFVGRDLRVFLNSFRTYPKVLRLRVNSYRKDLAILEYEVARDGSIASILRGCGSLFILHFEVVDGVERWRLILSRATRDSLSALRDSIGAVGNILRFSIAEPELSNVVDQYPVLSKYEEEALASAYSLGYIDYPRRARARDIARVLGISPATFIYHLRRAEKKLIGSYLRRNLRSKYM
jgi:predicted DNA binding protein